MAPYMVTSTAISILALSLAALDSIPAIQSIATRIALKSHNYEPTLLAKEEYRDEDGEATKESLQAFSDTWQKITIAVFSAAGFLITLALAVLTTLKVDVRDLVLLEWLQFGVWVSDPETNIPKRTKSRV
jgi:hypothetical protein